MAAGNSVDAEQLLKDGHTPPHQSDSPSGDEVCTSDAENVANILAPATASEEPSTCIADTPAQAVAVPEADQREDSEYAVRRSYKFQDPMDDLIDYIIDADSAIVEHGDLGVVLKEYDESLYTSKQEYIQWYLKSKQPPIRLESEGYGVFDWKRRPYFPRLTLLQGAMWAAFIPLLWYILSEWSPNILQKMLSVIGRKPLEDA